MGEIIDQYKILGANLEEKKPRSCEDIIKTDVKVLWLYYMVCCQAATR
jgi:hypothetical protein